MNEQWSKQKYLNILELSKAGQDYFSNKKYKSAEKIYDKTISLIFEELLDIFNIENSKLNLLVSKIESSFNMTFFWETTESVLDNIDNMKKLVNEDWWFSWWEDLIFSWLWSDNCYWYYLLIL